MSKLQTQKHPVRKGNLPDAKFLEDVIDGLTSSPKYLSSRYFYDETGDSLFQRIMHLDEYYLTRCEFEIFLKHKESMLEYFTSHCDYFHMIEFGAGDAYKTKILIEYFLKRSIRFEYNPIDISYNVIRLLSENLVKAYPSLQLAPINMEYFDAVEEVSRKDTCKKVILFLGSNIGNFTSTRAHGFFRSLAGKMAQGDLLLTGFDLKKDPEVILAAYNDSQGITRDFNLNLLHRINRELDADFNTDNFDHRPEYNPVTGAARSFLVSKSDHTVVIGPVPLIIPFQKGESMFMEISQKYSLDDIQNYAESSGFHVLENFFDEKKYFVNSLWQLD